MKKKAFKLGLCMGIFLTVGIVAYAVTHLFYMKSVTTDFHKKTVFQFDLDVGMIEGATSTIGPGDSFSVEPVIYNDATEDMYVFIKIEMPAWGDDSLYTYEVDEEWIVVESTSETVVYAYAGSNMRILSPGESTSALTDHMTMRSITYAEYAYIDDINVSITGYAIGVDGVGNTPVEVWNACKTIGNL